MEPRKFRELSATWEALGEIDPLFGVLSDPARQGGRWEAEEFFASGRAHVESLFRMLADMRATFDTEACLDFGCGVGRLTIPLSASFARTVGVDVAQSMIDRARRNPGRGARCEFVVNHDPDLVLFPDATFDVVHSCLVLQHLPPELAVRYIGEFFRVAKPGGLVVFQVPSATIDRAVADAAAPLPDSWCAADIVIVDAPATLAASQSADLRVAITNCGDGTWRHDIPGGRHLCLGNHWLYGDGTLAIQDDGRTPLPRTLTPGDRVEMTLAVQAPSTSGRFELEVDLVQEHVCWFAQKGSRTARAPIAVGGDRAARSTAAQARAAKAPPPPFVPRLDRAPRRSLLRRLARRFREKGRRPAFDMHVVPRPEVEKAISAGGGALLRAADDNAAGPGWLSYTYVCRRSGRSDG